VSPTATVVKLADHEFRQLSEKPVSPTTAREFKPIRLNTARS